MVTIGKVPPTKSSLAEKLFIAFVNQCKKPLVIKAASVVGKIYAEEVSNCTSYII